MFIVIGGGVEQVRRQLEDVVRSLPSSPPKLLLNLKPLPSSPRRCRFWLYEATG